jgi:hypothetical protein
MAAKRPLVLRRPLRLLLAAGEASREAQVGRVCEAVQPSRRRKRFGLGLSQPARETLVAVFVALGAVDVMFMWWHGTTPASVQGTGPWLTCYRPVPPGTG